MSRRSLMYFSISLLLLAVFLYAVSGVLAPFFVAVVLAYFLAPAVSTLTSFKIGRGVSTVLVMLCVLGLLAVFSFTVIPLFYRQVVLLSSIALSHQHDFNDLIVTMMEKYQFMAPMIMKAQAALTDASATILGVFGDFVASILHSGMAAASVIIMVFVSPIILYYILVDWPKFVATVDSVVPHKMAKRYKEIKRDLDITLSNYIRGQTLVCFIMSVYYALGMLVIGSKSWLALGSIAGVLTFIPYAGALFSMVLSMLIVGMESADLMKVLFVLGVFSFGQFLEGYVVVPKVMGGKLKLHPVWIMFGLFAGGTLMGFVGVLIALPLTALISVLIRYVLADYKKSEIYKG